MFNKIKILWIIKILLLATLITPLIVDSSVIFPFIFTKVIYFRILIDLAFISYLILIYKHKEYLSRLNFFVVSSFIFLLLAIIISVFGVDWNFSFWGGHERMEGVFNLMHYLIFAILLITIFTEKDWRIFLRTLLLISLVVLFKGFYEVQSLGVARVSGSLGNFIYFGEYSLFLFWLSLIFSFLTKIKWERYGAYILALLAVIGIFISGSRGPFLSLLVGLGIFALIYFFITKNRKIQLSLLAVTLVGILLVLGGIFLPSNVLVREIPIINNLSDIQNLDNSLGNRVLVAQIALESFKEKPFGWGFNNFSTAFNIHYQAEFLRRGWGDTFFDSSHNYYLDILVGVGILGLISFLCIFILIIYKLIKKIKHSEYKIFFVLLLALLISIMTQLFFSFLHPSFYLCLFSFLAFVVYAIHDQKMGEQILSKNKTYFINIIAVVLMIFSLWALFYGNIKAYSANRLDDKIRILILQNNTEEAILLAENSLNSMGPMHREITRDYVQNLIGATITTKEKEAYIKLLKDLEIKINQNLEKYNLNNTFDYLFLIRLNLILNNFEDRTVELEDIFTKAMAVNNQKQELNFLYFNYLVQSERIDEAKIFMEKIINDDSELYYGYWYLSKIYIYLGDIGIAYDYYQKAVDRGFVVDNSEDQDVIDFLLNKIDLMNE